MKDGYLDGLTTRHPQVRSGSEHDEVGDLALRVDHHGRTALGIWLDEAQLAKRSAWCQSSHFGSV